MPAEQVKASWRRLLIDVALSRNYQLYFSISSAAVRGSPRNPILEEILPSLLQIKAVTILDEALKLKLDQLNERPKDHGFKNDLNGHIETALAAGLLKDVTLLHRARTSRNDVAHEFAENIDWKRLDADIAAIHGALREMDLVGDLPKLEVKAERVPRKTLKDPKVAHGFDYSITVHAGQSKWAEISWSEEMLGLGE